MIDVQEICTRDHHIDLNRNFKKKLTFEKWNLKRTQKLGKVFVCCWKIYIKGTLINSYNGCLGILSDRPSGFLFKRSEASSRSSGVGTELAHHWNLFGNYNLRLKLVFRNIPGWERVSFSTKSLRSFYKIISVRNLAAQDNSLIWRWSEILVVK